MLADRNVAQNIRVVPDKDAVAQRGVPLAYIFSSAAQGHALVQRDVVANDCCLADHDSHSVIDKHSPPDARPRMNLHTRPKARDLREQASWELQVPAPDRKSTRLNSSHANISYA